MDGIMEILSHNARVKPFNSPEAREGGVRVGSNIFFGFTCSSSPFQPYCIAIDFILFFDLLIYFIVKSCQMSTDYPLQATIDCSHNLNRL